MPLTREQAIEVYRLATETQLKNTHIAAQTGCDEATVRKIKAKQRWKEATDEYDAERIQVARAGTEVLGGGGGGELLDAGRSGGMGDGDSDLREPVSGDDAGSGSDTDCEAVSAEGVHGKGEAAEGDGELLANHLEEGEADGSGFEQRCEEVGTDLGSLGSAEAAAGGEPAAAPVDAERITGSLDEQGRLEVTFTDPAQFVTVNAPRDCQPHHTDPQPADPFLAPNGTRDFWPHTVPEDPSPKVKISKVSRFNDPDAPRRPLVPDGLLPREAEVLTAAKRYGVVRIIGAYGGTMTTPEKIADPEERRIAEDEGLREVAEQFHSGESVMRQVRRGFLASGERANTFVLTDAGRSKLEELNAYLDAMVQWHRDRMEVNKKIRKKRSEIAIGKASAYRKARREEHHRREKR